MRAINKLSLAKRAQILTLHKTLRVTPAMAAGIETRLWSEDVARLIEYREDFRCGALLVG
jgi:hypothetical protein